MKGQNENKFMRATCGEDLVSSKTRLVCNKFGFNKTAPRKMRHRNEGRRKGKKTEGKNWQKEKTEREKRENYSFVLMFFFRLRSPSTLNFCLPLLDHPGRFFVSRFFQLAFLSPERALALWAVEASAAASNSCAWLATLPPSPCATTLIPYFASMVHGYKVA